MTEKTPSRSPNGGWIISYEATVPRFVNGFYPPEYHADYPAENCVEVTQERRDRLWEEMQEHRMCYDPVTGDFVPYVPPAPTLEQLKERKRAEIAATRYEAETRGITVNSVSVATDRDSQSLLTAAALSAFMDSTYTVEWKMTDGTFATLTAEQIIAIGRAVSAHVETCFSREKTLYAQVDAAQSAEDVAAITWPD